MILQAILLLLFAGEISGHPGGATPDNCGDMTPKHKVDPQSSQSPYSLTLEKSLIKPGESMTVKLGSPSGKAFKGFLVQGWSNEQGKPVGTFNSGSNWKTISCSKLEHSAITHNSREDKKEIVATWTAPSNYLGKVLFRYTFVENGAVFWVDKKTEEIEVSGPTVDPIGGVATTAKVDEINSNPFEHVYSGCYETKGCFGGPDDCVSKKDCRHMVTYKVVGDKIAFEMLGTTEGWLGVGISTDKDMGGDAVTSCTSQTVFRSWNERRSNVPLSNLQQGLSDIQTSNADSFLYCRFTHEGKFTVRNEEFNLINKTYYLFLGRGYMETNNPPQMQMHIALPYVTGVEASLIKVDKIGLASDLLIKLHGSLMIAAWIGTVSIAIFLARYYKQMWPSSKHCGEKVWFSWHRFLNVSTLLLTVAAFVLIFVQLGGWSEVWESNPHPIFGVVTTALVIVQPIMAAFRCHPGTPKRPIFNWLHFLVGNSAHIIAVITLFFARNLQKAQLPDFYMWVLIAFVAYHVIVFFIMESYMCFHGKKVRENQIALKDFSSSNGNAFSLNESKDIVGSRFRNYMLLLYIFGNVGFVIALIVIVVLSPVKER